VGREHLRIDQDGRVDGTRADRWWPEDEDDFEAATAELNERFEAWATRQSPKPPLDMEGILHYKWGYLDGHLTRWRRADLTELYLELYPAKVIMDEDELDESLEEGRTFLTFLAETGLLDADSESLDLLVEHLNRIRGRFRHAMGDPSRFSFGKRLWTQARAEGVTLDDQAGVDRFITEFNARPRSERDAILGKNLAPRQPARGGRITPPGTPPRPPSTKRRRRRR